MLAAVAIPTSVCGSKVTSLPDRFQRTTVTPGSSGINSQVFPGMNTLVHLQDGSTNTWTFFWFPMALVSPSVVTV